MLLPFLVLLPMAFLLPPGAQAGEIIGGQKAEPHSRPYMAYLERKVGPRVEKCGGFLVREDFVLTAAHCAKGEITVVLGAHDIRRQENTQQRIAVKKRILHPDYNSWSTMNDLMLLKLAKPAELNEAVDTIPLPQEDDVVEPGSVCSVAGWGRTSLNKSTTILHEVELEVTSDQICQEYKIFRKYYEPSMMMCVGNPRKKKASFSGDSGGPLVCDGTAQGIVSFGKDDGSPPRVFTKISTYISWIEEVLGDLRSWGAAP